MSHDAGAYQEPPGLFTTPEQDERLAELRRYVQAVWAPGWHALGVKAKGGEYEHIDTFDSPDAWIAAAIPYVLGDYHVWLMVNGMAVRPPAGKRGGNADITSSRALTMDLDYQAPEGAHANADLPTEDQILRALRRLGEAGPTDVVHTGWGFQPYWRLQCDIDPERRQGLLYAIAARLMELEPKLWIERLDVAGMFRVPGSTNIKVEGDPRLVVIEHWKEGPGFPPEYLEERCPPLAVPTHGGGTHHVPGAVTDAQRALLAHVVEHHGGHDEWATLDGQIRVVRPDKPASDGHSANIWMGDDGVAVITVFSSNWKGLGPEPPESVRSWALRVDGAGLVRPSDIKTKMILPESTPTGQAYADSTRLPDRFWERKNHATVSDAAFRIGVSPEALMLAVLTLIASHIPAATSFPGKRKGAVNLLGAIVGPPGRGKGTTIDRARELMPPPLGASTYRPGTAQGLVKEFYELVPSDPNDPKSKKVLARHTRPVFLRVDEIAKFTAAAKSGSERGDALIGELKQAVFGEGLGQSVATDEKRLRCDPHSYRLTGVIGVAPSTQAGTLFDDTDGGFPQRLLFANLLRPEQAPTEGIESFEDMTLGDDQAIDGGRYVALPRLAWTPPLGSGGPFKDSKKVVERLAAMERARWDLLDAHVPYLTHAIAAVLAYLDQRWVIQPADLTLAGDVVRVSQAARSHLLAELRRSAETGEKRRRDQQVATAVATRTAVLNLERLDGARAIVANARRWKADKGEWPTVRNLQRKANDYGRWALDFAEAINLGWLRVEDQETSAGGSPKRVVIVTEQAP
jgi:hypothetical protein